MQRDVIENQLELHQALDAIDADIVRVLVSLSRKDRKGYFVLNRFFGEELAWAEATPHPMIRSRDQDSIM